MTRYGFISRGSQSRPGEASCLAASRLGARAAAASAAGGNV